MFTPGQQFAHDVVSGEIMSGKKRIQACQRFLDELEKQKDPSYPWLFNTEKATYPTGFMEKFLVPTKGNYTRMEILPWQSFIVENAFGWVSKKTGYRRFHENLVIVGQGNGKSTLISGLAAETLTKDGERGAEIYTLANSKDQAKIVFGECSAAIKASPALSKHIKVTRDGIFYGASKIVALASDSKTLDGLNVHVAIFDEIHEFRDYKLINTIKGKTKKRKQPLIFISQRSALS